MKILWKVLSSIDEYEKRYDNPFARLECGNVQIDRRHEGRELTEDELRRLMTAAKASTRSFRGLNRYHLYLVAAATGFRAPGLASLTPQSSALDDPCPVMTLAARRNKSRKHRRSSRSRPTRQPPSRITSTAGCRDNRSGAAPGCATTAVPRCSAGASKRPASLTSSKAGRSSALRRLPRPAAHLPDPARAGRGRFPDRSGTCRSLHPSPYGSVFAPSLSLSGSLTRRGLIPSSRSTAEGRPAFPEQPPGAECQQPMADAPCTQMWRRSAKRTPTVKGLPVRPLSSCVALAIGYDKGRRSRIS